MHVLGHHDRGLVAHVLQGPARFRFQDLVTSHNYWSDGNRVILTALPLDQEVDYDS